MTSLFNKYGIKAINEEMNTEALSKEGVEHTVPKQVADHLCLTHCYCEPDESTRDKLGIQNEGVIRVQSLFHEWSQDQEQAQVQEEHRKRERVWLQELKVLPETPILFVCGSDHTLAFASLLKKNGYECIIISEAWTPN